MEIASKTDVGVERKQNQDQVGVFYNQDQAAILLLCDGMGGHNAGDVASEMAIYHVGNAWKGTENMTDPNLISDWLTSQIKEANAHIFEKANQYHDLSGMGTTIVAAVPLEDLAQVVLAHVGDSRIYIHQVDELKQITKDHSFVQELLAMDMITKEEAQVHPQKNIVTRAVGIAADVEVDINVVDFLVDDTLLLCSDGLTDMVDETEVLAILSDERRTIEEKADQLIALANDHGGRDNVSVVVAHRTPANLPKEETSGHEIENERGEI
ncbi:Stp1/IreP family PP2C-type Ser/Thr phosphatase [Aerococcus urinaeequi]|uniref:Stp1/IreP family PP2C-type Ser/Thr phosphatase n=1 Tax=Aerococcus urinaeequi TaxID=51665 RepID=UPI0008462708|nr:Stp1/IreP family PP2C-type Ser/Thr phosphatase [Aerococcus urinaeequi]